MSEKSKIFGNLEISKRFQNSQQIICQKGKCHENGTLEGELDSLFDHTNLVENIQHDLLKESIRD